VARARITASPHSDAHVIVTHWLNSEFIWQLGLYWICFSKSDRTGAGFVTYFKMSRKEDNQRTVKHYYYRGRMQGGPGSPIIGKVNFISLHCIQCLKKLFLKLNLDFIVAEIREVFRSVGVYACVCESNSWPLLFFLFCKGPDCRKSHLIFQNFWGRPPDPALAPSALSSGLRPLIAPRFPKFLDPPLIMRTTAMANVRLAEINIQTRRRQLWDTGARAPPRLPAISFVSFSLKLRNFI